MRLSTFSGVISLILLTACGGDGGGPDPTPTIASVTISSPVSTLGAAGATTQYSAVVRNSDDEIVTGATIAWSSSATGVATISSTGLATAVAPGTTTITATVGSVTGSSTLTVVTQGTIQGTVTTVNGPFVRSQRATGKGVGARWPIPPSSPKPALAQRLRTAAPRPAPRRARAVPGELVVMLRPQAAIMATAASIRAAEGTGSYKAALTALLSPPGAGVQLAVTGFVPSIGAVRVRVPSSAPSTAAMAQLKRNPDVVSVEPNWIYHATGDPVASMGTTLPNDPLYAPDAWNYRLIGLPYAWSLTTGSSGVLVAVVDDGIRFDHPDVAGNLTSDGYDFVSTGITFPVCAGGDMDETGDGDGPDPDPTQPMAVDFNFNGCSVGPAPIGNHGLHVAGIVGAVGNDNAGIVGVNWVVRIRPVRVLGVTGSGAMFDVVQGILYAAGLPADAGGTFVTAPSRAPIINLSLAGPNDALALQSAVQAAAGAGSLLIAASGNEGTATPMYPAAYPEVVTVGAVAIGGTRADYSSFGSHLDIAAPGGSFPRNDPTFGVLSSMWDYQAMQPAYAFAIGTSMAAPHVSGTAALLLARTRGLTAPQLRALLEDWAVDAGPPGVDDQFGHGIVSARNSLFQNLGPVTSTRVFLVDSATGATVQAVDASSTGAYQFSNVPGGKYLVYAGQDEDGDHVYGRGLRRWGAYGLSAKPATVTVSGGSGVTADFSIGTPVEQEFNDMPEGADLLVVGGYITASIRDPLDDIDIVEVRIPATGTYTFWTEGLVGSCGFGPDEDTILTLYSQAGQVMMRNDDTDASRLNYCSTITRQLARGKYYLSVVGYATSTPAPNRRYALYARAGE